MKDLQINLPIVSKERVEDFDEKEFVEVVKGASAGYMVSIIIDETTLQEAKSKLADLRKKRDLLEAFRKACQNEYTKPSKEFGDKIKNILNELDKPISHLDSIIKDYENEEIDLKIDQVEKYWSTKNLGPLFPFSFVYITKWRQKGQDLKTIRTQLDQISTDCRRIKELIETTENPVIKDVLLSSLTSTTYNETLFLMLEGQKNKLILADQEKSKPVETVETMQATTEGMKISVEDEIFEEEEKIQMNVFLRGTKTQLKNVFKYCRDLGVEYGRN